MTSPSSRKPIPRITLASGMSEDEQRSRRKARNSFQKLRVFATSVPAMPEALQQGNPSDFVSLGELAQELGTPLDRIQPLLDRGYLRPAAEAGFVIRPQPAAIEWLRTMFQPFAMRPFLPTEMVAEITGTKLNDVRRLCLIYNIPLQDDPVFGELMSIHAFHRFFNSLHHFREPSRFDRQALLTILHTSYQGTGKAMRTLPFSKRLEAEIRRIAKLPEPDRLSRAMALMEAYEDAKSISDCLARYEEKVESSMPEMESLEQVIQRSIGVSP